MSCLRSSNSMINYTNFCLAHCTVPAVTNGVVSASEATKFNHSAILQYTCNQSYKKTVRDDIICLESNSWSAEAKCHPGEYFWSLIYLVVYFAFSVGLLFFL